MSFSERLVYVLRHAWLWPLVFWLRPIEVRERLRASKPGMEESCAVLGGAFWGALGGASIWACTGEITAVPVLAAALASAFAISLAIAPHVLGPHAVVGDVTVGVSLALVLAVTGVGALASAGVGALAGAGAVAGAAAGAIAGAVAGRGVHPLALVAAAVYFNLNAANGILTGRLIPQQLAATLVLGIGFATVCVPIWVGFQKVTPTWAAITEAMLLGVGLPIVGFMLFPGIDLAVVPVWGMALVAGMAVGTVGGFFLFREEATANVQAQWLSVQWGLFLLVSLGAWYLGLGPETLGFDGKFQVLGLFLLLGAPVVTGLPFWPLGAVIAAWQFRPGRATAHRLDRFSRTLPFRWQSFAYPLPRLRTYLRALAAHHGSQAAFEAIRAVQHGSLQTAAARRAALALAGAPDTALAFSAAVAHSTNARTVEGLGLAGPAARAIAVLSKALTRDDKQPLLLYLGRLPVPPEDMLLLHAHILLLYAQRLDWQDGFETARAGDLEARIAYARDALRNCEGYADAAAFLEYLDTLGALVSVENLEGFHPLQRPPAAPEAQPAWLEPGRQMLGRIEAALRPLLDYRAIGTAQGRREFLEQTGRTLEAIRWDDLPAYWGHLGAEVQAHWAALLARKAKEAREWLRLDISPADEVLGTGTQSLGIRVRNPTSVLAQKIRVLVDETEGFDWHHREAKQRFLDPGREALLRLEFEARRAGRYRLSGRLEAEDSAGAAFAQSFAFEVRVEEPGAPYRIPPYQPYVAGEGIGSERDFVGRTELLHWLRGLWLRPQGKPAVVLVGQRRIGKTSLLNKIRRDGLPDTGLLPILISIQGVTSEFDFLQEALAKMAETLGSAAVPLDREEPYAGFKGRLREWRPVLDTRRFLLMLDEADLLPGQQLGERLPGFLRSLMQEPDYPTLLLFCGTHALNRMSRDYSSILFNTAQFRTVSYMTEVESAEVLTKPAQGILRYDPAALREAYRMTRGQPYQLQALGATLIERFDAAVLDGKKRSDYVSLADLDQAATALVEERQNAAFENHWADADRATHRLLAGLAWATSDEGTRVQIDLAGIEAALRETRLDLPPGEAFRIVERLADEEVVERDGPTYRYAVPLYRRWVSWRWPPERIREEWIAGVQEEPRAEVRLSAGQG